MSKDDNKKLLYKFHRDCGRMGDLSGVFIATVNEVFKALGKEVYFGSVLGKHSEIHGPLEEGDLEKLCVPDVVIEAFEEYNLCTGYNPLNFIEEV